MRINLGSGQRPFDAGWVNVDSQARWAPDVCAEGISYLQGLGEGSVKMICLHHVLEHYGCGEADSMLAECHRTLRPGGSLLVFVPDMRKLVGMWNEDEIDTQIFLTNVYGAYMGDEADRHKWGFTWTTLMQTIAKAGRWSRRMKFDHRVIPGADIARDDRWILGVEAVR